MNRRKLFGALLGLPLAAKALAEEPSPHDRIVRAIRASGESNTWAQEIPGHPIIVTEMGSLDSRLQFDRDGNLKVNVAEMSLVTDTHGLHWVRR